MIGFFLSNRYNESIMKRMSAVFPITCILLAAAGASGLVMDFMLAVEKMKDIDCPKFLAVLVIVMGLAWAVAAIITGINGYAEAKRVIRQQRKRTPAARGRAKLNGRQLAVRAILVIAICAVEIIFALLTGLKTGQLLYFVIAGLIIPYLFMISGKANIA